MIIKILIIGSWIFIFLLALYYQIKIFQHIKDPEKNKINVLFFGPFINKNVFDDAGQKYFFKYRLFGFLIFISAVFVIEVFIGLIK
jgi:hypothetical protein